MATERQLGRILDKVLRSKATIPSTEDLVTLILDEFGGSRKFAVELVQHYRATQSPMVKAKILDAVMKLIVGHSKGNPKGDLAKAPTEDLEEIARAMMTYAKAKEAEGPIAAGPAAGTDGGNAAAGRGPDSGHAKPGPGAGEA